MKLSIVLCTYNPKAAYLRRAMDSVVGQLAEVSYAEFILVDNNSTPPLSERDGISEYPCRIVREERQGLTAARIAGIKAAVGDIVLFIDDDNVLDAGFLKGVVRAFEDPKLGLLGCAVIPEYEVSPPAWFRHFEHQLAIRRYDPDLVVETTSLPYTQYFPIGAGFSMRRALALEHTNEVERTGSFIEGRKGASLSSGEDLDLAFFCLRRGYKLRAQGSLRLTHIIPAMRLREDYTVRIAVSSLKSSRELNEKWAPEFGRPIFHLLEMPQWELCLRIAAHWLLGNFRTENRLKGRILSAFLDDMRK